MTCFVKFQNSESPSGSTTTSISSQLQCYVMSVFGAQGDAMKCGIAHGPGRLASSVIPREDASSLAETITDPSPQL